MKKSKQPTHYIILKASTKSEWDDCDFAIIKIDDEWRSLMSHRLKLLEPFKGMAGFYSHTYWDAPIGYYVGKQNMLDKIFRSEDGWSYIILEDGELDMLEEPESRLDTHMLFINIAGSAHFMCYGKHTGEEYSTDSIDIYDIINTATNTNKYDLKRKRSI